MASEAERITSVPSFVLRDDWIEGRITTEQYNAEVQRRLVEQATLVAKLVTCKLALSLIVDRTKDCFAEPLTREQILDRVKTMRSMAEHALGACKNVGESK